VGAGVGVGEGGWGVGVDVGGGAGVGVAERVAVMADKEPGLDELLKKATADGAPKAVLTWRYRLAKASGRRAVARFQLRSVVGRERSTPAEVRAAEQELADAEGATVFCREMLCDHASK
jgi:hypothetical protein